MRLVTHSFAVIPRRMSTWHAMLAILIPKVHNLVGDSPKRSQVPSSSPTFSLAMRECVDRLLRRLTIWAGTVSVVL